MLYDTYRFLAGAAAGVIMSIAWYNILSTKFGIHIVSDSGLEGHGFKGPASLEHYHIGLFFLILSTIFSVGSVGFLVGLGLSLIVVEAFQKNPFGVGKDHFFTSTAIGAGLLILLATLYIK